MKLEVVVPLNRSSVLAPMLRSFARQSVVPHMVTLVTNWDTDKLAKVVEEALRGPKLDLPVRQLTFATDVYAYGYNDAGLRRNIAMWESGEEAALLFDDDQIPARDTVESSLRCLDVEPWVFGNHRYIDFESVDTDELIDLPAERGRSRENPPNHWHTYHSALGGNQAVRRQTYRDIGGYDLIYTRGSDDINLGRRAVGEGHMIVREPPFAWHPTKALPFDLLMAGNICLDHKSRPAWIDSSGLSIVVGENPPPRGQGGRRSWSYAKCSKCPWVEPNPGDPLEIVHHLGPVLKYDPKNVRVQSVKLW